MPVQQGVGGNQRGHAGQELPSQGHGFDSQSPALVSGQPEATSAKTLAQDGVLGAEVINDLLLLAVGVAGDDASEQVPRLQDEVHSESGSGRAEASIVGHGVGVVKRPNQAPIYGTQ